MNTGLLIKSLKLWMILDVFDCMYNFKTINSYKNKTKLFCSLFLHKSYVLAWETGINSIEIENFYDVIKTHSMEIFYDMNFISDKRISLDVFKNHIIKKIEKSPFAFLFAKYLLCVQKDDNKFCFYFYLNKKFSSRSAKCKVLLDYFQFITYYQVLYIYARSNSFFSS